MAYLYFVLVSLIWSCSFLLMKKATLAFSPLMVGAWRVLIGALVLAAFARGRAGLKRGDGGWMAAVVFGGYIWPYGLQPFLVEQVGSAFVGIFVSLTPLLTVIVAAPMLGVWPKPGQLIGVIGAVLCILVLTQDALDRQFNPWVLLLGTTVPLGYAVTNTIMRRSLNHVSPLLMTFVCLASSSAVLLPMAYASPGKQPAGNTLWIAVGSIAVLGAFGTGLAIYMFNWMVRERGPLFAGMVTNLTPVGAVVLGWFDGEAVTWRQGLALVGIVVMVALVQYSGRKPPEKPAEG